MQLDLNRLHLFEVLTIDRDTLMHREFTNLESLNACRVLMALISLKCAPVAVTFQTILGEEQETWAEAASDVALLLANCTNVVSAGVPRLTEELTDAIFEVGYATQFQDMTVPECLEWLKTDGTKANAVFEQIMTQHGHRCIREVELYERSWRDEPEKLVRMVQACVRSRLAVPTAAKEKKSEDKKIDNIEAMLQQIRTKLTNKQKRLLKWSVPKARIGVTERERLKSFSVFSTDLMKSSLRHLGKLLVRDLRIPEADLIFFMTLEELGSFVRAENASATLIKTAIRRRRIYEQAFALQFNELSPGIPEPLKENTTTLACGSRLTGMPVCRGRVKARACVLKSLDEAKTIQHGDILIVRFTDIGWTPLFPSIGGLVTERGGLLSHGATIAREYGLACIVNCPGATSAFKTGDTVILDSTEGYIEKVLVE